MALSLRIPVEKEKMIKKEAERMGKTKTAFILEAIDEKLGVKKSRLEIIRELAGWMPHDEAEQLRSTTEMFDHIYEGDWD